MSETLRERDSETEGKRKGIKKKINTTTLMGEIGMANTLLILCLRSQVNFSGRHDVVIWLK